MRVRKVCLLGLSVMLGLCAVARAEDKPAPDKPVPDKPASQPSTAPAAGAMIEAIDQDALKAAVGKTVTVHGTISGTFKPKSGILLVIFQGATRGFTLMIPKDSVEGVAGDFNGDIDKELNGKAVLVTGEVKLYKDRPEMEITSGDQIKLADK
jgi:DNA/RNA endonuclease YhcR with UshA esterase domain